MPYGVFIDWAHVDRRGVCGPYNAIFATALESLGAMATLKGDSHTLGLTRELRQAISRAFDPTLFDEQLRCYADASVDGVLSDRVSEHGNMAPIFAGLRDGDRVVGVRATGRSQIRPSLSSDRFMTDFRETLKNAV